MTSKHDSRLTQPTGDCGLYVHIPFCLKKCHYCDFVITTQRAPEDRSRFLEALKLEINFSKQKYGRLKFSTAYLGGGTPSSLESAEFESVCAMLHDAFDFKKDFEFTVEVNPGDINQEKMNAYCRAEVNRVSLGVQSFQERLLRDMNRPHAAKEIEQTVQMLRQSGLANISMDIIVHLPDQTIDDVKETLKDILKLNPNQVSVYDLDVHEKTAYGMRRREGRLNLPSEDEHALMSKTVIHTLETAGFVHYELSNFAKPGFESKHNLIYWNNQRYLGLGPGAFSYLDGIRYQFAGSVESYLRKSFAEDWKNETEDRLSPEEIEKETLLTGIRLKEGIDLRRLPLYGQAFENVSQLWIEEGLLEKDEFRLKFTPMGKPVAEIILQAFAQVELDTKGTR